MAEAFGGVYKCPKDHQVDLWFFDSKPQERPCPYCDDGTKALLIHVKDMVERGRKGALARLAKREKGTV